MPSLKLLVICLCVGALSACAPLSELFEGGKEEPVVTKPVVDAEPADSFTELMRKLAEADAAERSALYQTHSNAYIDQPNLANRLRFAMVVSTPAHHASDPIEARRILTDLVSKPRSLSDAQLNIATFYLRDLEDRLSLESEIKELNSQLAELRPEKTNNDAQLRAVLAENQRLQTELDAANAKLEALTSIERSIETTEDGNNP